MGFNPDKIADYISDVSRIKNALLADDVDLSGPDGAFQITKRFAWVNGLFLVRKTQGNNSHGFQVDTVAAADGAIADILRDAGGDNSPQFTIQANHVDLSSLAPAFNDWDKPAPVESVDDFTAQLAKINTLLAALVLQVDDTKRAIQQQIDQAIKNAERSAAPVVALLETFARK